MLPRLAIALCAALLLAISASWTAAQADDPDDGESSPTPLTIAFQADASVCTAGSQTQVHWQITGGAKPYQITLNGNLADAESTSAPIPCGDPLNIPTWLRGIIQPQPVTVNLSTLDAAGSEATQTLTLKPAPPLPAPTADLRRDYAQPTIVATVRGLRAETNQTRRYLVRWRPAGTATWNNHTYTAPPEFARFDRVLEYDTGARGVRFEAEVAQVRSLAEQATPQILNWSEPAYATTSSKPLNLTAQMTHDTITLSWEPGVEGLSWQVTVTPQGDHRHGRWQWETEHLGPDLPYEITYDGLMSDSVYNVEVALFPIDLFEPLITGLQVRTEPAPPGWSREPRQPQNVSATARGGGIEVTWDPPAVGTVRGYEIHVWEYGAPRPEPIQAAAAVRRVFVENRPLDTTYHVIVRHVGVEDEEAHVILEPPTSTRESVKTMTLPEWAVRYQDARYSDGSYYYEFTATWVLTNELDIDLVQFRWRKDGYTMTRSARFPRISIWTADPGPHWFQARIRDRDGYWSQWSTEQRVSATSEGPRGLDVRERKGTLVVSWQPPRFWYNNDLSDQVDGVRVYLSRHGEPDQVQDVGHATSAEFPIEADGGEYGVRVAAYIDGLGEGKGRFATFDQAEGPSFSLISDYAGPEGWVCDPYAEIPVILRWDVWGGAAPYTIQIGDEPAFETLESWGLVDLECDPGDEFGEQSVHGVATDAYGRSITSSALYHVVDSRTDDGEATLEAERWRQMMDGLAFDGLSIHRESLVLRWNRVSWADRRLARFVPSFLVRWRESGSEIWRYRTVDDPKWICPDSSWWELTDLDSDTQYDIQIAPYWSQEERAKPEQLGWSEPLSARTLPASIRATVQRRGADIVVSWPSIPDAWGYQVRLDATGINWLMDYEPHGMGVEEAVFAGVPLTADPDLQVEVTSPPGLGKGKWSPSFDRFSSECADYH